MITTSADFKTKVLSGAFKRLLFDFGATVLTDDEIKAAVFTEAAMTEDALTLGSCPSASLEFDVSNVGNAFSGFAWGQFAAWAGVETGSAAYTVQTGEVCRAESGANVLTGYAATPYLKIGGSAANIQPGFAVRSIVVDGSNVYCLGANDAVWAATISGTTLTVRAYTADAVMLAKAKRWCAAKMGITRAGRFVYTYGSGVKRTMEYCPLGVFYAQQPEQSHASIISVSAYDKMAALDVDATEWWNALTWPRTIGAIFTAFCTQYGLTAAASTFVNSTVSIPSRPVEATAVTAREVLRWIAEAAGSFARFDREGRLELAWFAAADAEVDDASCFEREVAEYRVPAVSKLVAQGALNDVGVTVGTGGNAYGIMDNPLLYGLTAAEILGKAQPIYDRLAAFAAYTPITARCLGDWSIQAGDVITLTAGSTEYRLPVFMQTIEFNGAATATYESHGSAAGQEIETHEKRETLATRRLIHTVKNTLEELSSTFEEVTGEINDTLTTHTTQIAQNAAQILLKAAQTVVDALTGRVETAEASITVQAGQIALKASQSSVDALGNRVSSAESSITQNANQIATKVSQTDFNALGVRVGTAESNITQNANSIATKVSQTAFNALGTRVSTAESSITQNATSITTKVSKNNIISEINQTAEQIKIKAEKLTLDGLVTITGLSGGTTTINGACITTGKISADRINVPNIDADKITSGTFIGRQYKTTVGGNGLWVDSNGINFLTVPSGDTRPTDNSGFYSRIEYDNAKTVGTAPIGATTTWKATNTSKIDIGQAFTGSAGPAIRVAMAGEVPTLYLPYLGSQSGGNYLTIGANGVIGRGTPSGGGGSTSGYSGPIYANWGGDTIEMMFSNGLLQSWETI